MPERYELRIIASATCRGNTGVEMEAMTAASVAALTVYDMCKVCGRGAASKAPLHLGLLHADSAAFTG